VVVVKDFNPGSTYLQLHSLTHDKEEKFLDLSSLLPLAQMRIKDLTPDEAHVLAHLEIESGLQVKIREID
jgi:hypothetical protein